MVAVPKVRKQWSKALVPKMGVGNPRRVVKMSCGGPQMSASENVLSHMMIINYINVYYKNDFKCLIAIF